MKLKRLTQKYSTCLLQVLDNGHLTDAKGRKVNFKNTVIIMTSNLGANISTKCSASASVMGEGEKEIMKMSKTKVMDSLKEFFRPEFLNRVDDIIVFDILSQKAIQKIVEIQINLVKERLAAKRN
jgi:ATP-dependent Clp protease ATP-binding subunit ClpA